MAFRFMSDSRASLSLKHIRVSMTQFEFRCSLPDKNEKCRKGAHVATNRFSANLLPITGHYGLYSKSSIQTFVFLFFSYANDWNFISHPRENWSSGHSNPGKCAVVGCGPILFQEMG